MYKYIMFDLDGTITDPREGITGSVQYALSRMGIEEPDRKKLEPFIGPPLLDSFQRYYGFSEEQARQAVVYYRENFTAKGLYQNKLFEGVPEMLKMLKENGCTTAIASSKPELFVQQILEHFGICQYFDYVCGATMDETRTQKEEVIEELLSRMKLTAEQKQQLLMVGDRKFDVEGAACFGIPCLGISLGFAEDGELEAAGAVHIVDSVREIGEFVLKSLE